MDAVPAGIAVGLLFHSLQGHELVSGLASPDFADLNFCSMLLGFFLPVLLRNSLFDWCGFTDFIFSLPTDF